MREYIVLQRQEDGTVAFSPDERYADYLEGWAEYIDELIDRLPAKKKKYVMSLLQA